MWELRHTGSGSALLTLDQRLNVLERYADGNLLLSERYLDPAVAAALFAPPSPKDVVALGDVDRLQTENGLLARAVFNLALDVQNLEVRLLAFERSEARQSP
jgi:hypothetical protein